MKNPYEVLGVSSDISTDDLKKVYKKLCRQYHPDNCGSSDKFTEISKAYNMILSGGYTTPKVDTVVHNGLFKYKMA